MRLRSTRLSSISSAAEQSDDALISGIFSSSTGLLLDARIESARYQDNTGMTLAGTSGNVVGLMLDQSKTLAAGPELVANGGFDTAASWTMSGGSAISSGRLVFAAAAVQRPYNSGGTLADRTNAHWLGVNFSKDTSNFGVSPALYNSSGTLLAVTPSPPRLDNTGTYRIFVPANSSPSNFSLGFNRSIGYTGSCAVDNVSLKLVAGNHALQGLLTSKPKYQITPQRIEFDMLDDALSVSFPISLGSDCTVVYAAPGVGAVVLIGQTIGATYSISQSFAWLLISNRTLTAAELSACVNRANQRSF